MANEETVEGEDGSLIPRKRREEMDLAVDPVVQNLMRIISLLISAIKGKTGKCSKLLSKIDLVNHLKKGSQLVAKTVLRAFTAMVNKIMESEELKHIKPLIDHYSSPNCNRASLNDLEHLEGDARPGTLLQWQTVQIPSIRFKRHRSYTHLQAQWKNNGQGPSRCSSRVQHFSPPSNSSNSLDDDELEDLESERLSQVSGSAITAVNVAADQNRLNNLEQELAELRKQMAIIFEQKRLENVKQEKDNSMEVSSTSSDNRTAAIAKKAVPAAPVPPPPAPPPPPPGLFKSKSSTSSIKSVASSVVSKVSPEVNSQSTSSNLSLKDVLKDLDKVKSGLRKVERSPNGTPMRSSTDTTTSSSQFFEAALAKLFHTAKITEVESDNDVESNGPWEDETEETNA